MAALYFRISIWIFCIQFISFDFNGLLQSVCFQMLCLKHSITFENTYLISCSYHFDDKLLHQIYRLSLKCGFGGCGHRFDRCDGLGGLGGFDGIGGIGGLDEFSRFDGFDGLSGFCGFDGFNGFDR